MERIKSEGKIKWERDVKNTVCEFYESRGQYKIEDVGTTEINYKDKVYKFEISQTIKTTIPDTYIGVLIIEYIPEIPFTTLGKDYDHQMYYNAIIEPGDDSYNVYRFSGAGLGSRPISKEFIDSNDPFTEQEILRICTRLAKLNSRLKPKVM